MTLSYREALITPGLRQNIKEERFHNRAGVTMDRSRLDKQIDHVWTNLNSICSPELLKKWILKIGFEKCIV